MADSHLGCNWPPIPDKNLVQARIFTQAFEKCIDDSIEKNVDFVLHAGDLADDPRPNIIALECAFNQLRKLEEKGIPFIITRGTHDTPRSFPDRISGNLLTILEQERKAVYVDETFGNKIYYDLTVDDSLIRIYGLGDHGRNQMKELQSLSKLISTEPDFSILVMHSSIADVPYNIGATLRVRDLKQLCLGINYFALGHDHSHFEYAKEAIYNPGSTVCSSFKEGIFIKYLYQNSELIEINRSENRKGYYLVDVTDNNIDTEFIELPSRPVHTVQVEFNQATPAQIHQATSEALHANEEENWIVRTVITGSLAKGYRYQDINLQEIHENTNGMYVGRPICIMTSNSLDSQFVPFEGDYQQILLDYFNKKGWTEASAQKLTDFAITLVNTISSKSVSKDEATQKTIDIINAFEIWGVTKQ